MASGFQRFAQSVSHSVGTPAAFIAALALVIGWLAVGPLAHFSDSWELVINTVTTIITFLMVFLIQNTQNRDTVAIQLKLDELIRANQRARNMMLCLEDLSEEELKRMKATFASLAGAPRDAAGKVLQEALEEVED